MIDAMKPRMTDPILDAKLFLVEIEEIRNFPGGYFFHIKEQRAGGWVVFFFPKHTLGHARVVCSTRVQEQAQCAKKPNLLQHCEGSQGKTWPSCFHRLQIFLIKKRKSQRRARSARRKLPWTCEGTIKQAWPQRPKLRAIQPRGRGEQRIALISMRAFEDCPDCPDCQGNPRPYRGYYL